MLTEKNFAEALKAMNFTADGDTYEKIFAEGFSMKADLKARTLHYPAQIKNHTRNIELDDSHRENLVVFECVNRLLDKGYNPADIWLEKPWQLGHSPKSGRADICVAAEGRTLFIVECKTFDTEFNRELANMRSDGGQLFSYWQQEQSCQWLVLYASTFDSGDGALKFSAASVFCGEDIYRDAHTVPERFKLWSDRHDKNFLGDVLFHEETRAYQIGVKPLRKRDLKDFDDTSLVNKFEEILRHNAVSDKENAFNRLIALFICKLADEYQADERAEVNFQFKDLADTHEAFQDRLQRLYRDGMKKFMGEDIFYLPEDYPERLFENFSDEENHDNQIRDLKANFRKLKFYTNNAFAFVEVNNEKLFRLNAKVLVEVVNILRDYRIIGSKDLQTLGDLFEQLLDKGFKQDAGQFFTPTPIAQFIWDSLPLDDLIEDAPPKIIDYACGAGHFLTEGFKAVNDYFARKNVTPPPLWERDKLFGVEKDYRLARVSKISLFMHGADEGKIKFGDGLENYPEENIKPATFDILVANPPYSVKGFKAHLKLANDSFDVLDKISNSGSEIETLFVERIAQLVKPRGVAAVILPSSILNKDGKSFIAAREALLKSFYVRAIVQLGSKTFGATGTNTVIMFLERFDEPPRKLADFEDVADSILRGKTLGRQFSRDIFAGYLKTRGKGVDDYRRFISDASAKTLEVEREKITYFGLTYRQKTLIISAPGDNKEQEIFLGYGWSNAKGREGIVYKKRGGLLFDNANRAAEDTLAAVIRAAFRGEQINLRGLEKYYSYSALADLLDFDAANFTKKITLSELSAEDLKTNRKFPTTKLDNLVEINSATLDPTKTPEKIFHYVDIGAVDAATNRINFSNTITGAEAPSRARRLASDGDVLISTVRPYLKSFAQVKDAPQDTLYSTGFAILSTKNPAVVTNEFIFRLFMDDPLLMAQMKAKMSKGSYPSINQDDVKGFYVLLPPADVQRQIVDEFKAIDAQLTAQDETLTSLDADVQAKFAALFESKDFPIRKLGEVCNVARGGSPRPINDYITDDADGINWIKIGDADESRYITKTAQRIKPEGKNKSRYVRAGDFLLSNSMTFGKPYILKIDGCIHDGWLVLDYDKNLLEENYFHAYLSSPPVYKIMAGMASGSVVNNLNSEVIKKLPVVLPPLELQEEFAAYVRNCEALKESARARREELLALRAELVTKYFR